MNVLGRDLGSSTKVSYTYKLRAVITSLSKQDIIKKYSRDVRLSLHAEVDIQLELNCLREHL